MRRSCLVTLLSLACAPAWSPAQPPYVATTEHKSPADERATFRLPPGFEAQLVAAEPDIQKPINIAFDARDRLWASCTVDYPFPAAEGKGRDTVKVLEDFGPDGRARKVTTFAEGLNIPIGILPYKDGAIVYSIPNIWFLRDTDGDGKCDTREVLLTGFGHRDTHGMVNGLLLGFDGWVYACHGYANDSHVKAKDGSEVRMNSGNTFRFKPDGSRVEIVCRGQVNPFGQCLDPLGNLYTACCHSKPITQLLRGAVYSSFTKPHDGLGFGPDMVQNYRGSTALCGLAWYEADHYPATYNSTMFLGDVVNNCVNVFDVERKGATYTARQRPRDFLASSDPWFRPVDIKLGPDGALYVADFYNRIIGHYEVPLTHPGRDRESGRIWRVVYRGEDGKGAAPIMAVGRWEKHDWSKQLIRDLENPNITVRMLAIGELERLYGHELRGGGNSPLVQAVSDFSKTASPTGRVHALWLHQRLNYTTRDEIQAALAAPDVMLRVHAIRILAEEPKLTRDQRNALHSALADSDHLVRRVAADALGRHPARSLPEELRAARAEAGGDQFLVHAIRVALREQMRGRADWDFFRSPEDMADIALGLPEPGAANFLVTTVQLHPGAMRAAEYVRHAAHYADAERLPLLVMLVQRLATGREGAADAVILALIRGFQERGQALPADTVEWAVGRAAETIRTAKSTGDLQRGLDIALALNHRPLAANIATVGLDRQRPDSARVAALTALTRLDPTGSVAILSPRLADATESQVVREAVVKTLAEVNQPAARTALAEALPTAPARLATAIALALAGTPAGAAQLCDAVGAGKASPHLLTERTVVARLEASRLPGVKERIAKLTGGLPPADATVARLLRQRQAGFQKAKPDVAAGAKLYTQHCAACHQIAGQGTKVGPQLDGIGARGLERLLEDVLDPHRNVDQTFRATTVTLKNGRQVTGLVLREEGQVLVLADAQGKEVRVEAGQIEQKETQPLSPMPGNWAEQIEEKGFYDLLAYLLSQRSK